MGAILSAPVKSKFIERLGDKHLRVASAECQGFRTEMEDHGTKLLQLGDKHPNISFFAVFDGHGGSCASAYLAKELHLTLAALDDPTDPAALSAAIMKTDQDFLNSAGDQKKNHGSTACFALIEKPDEKSEGKYKITVGNVGDSRTMIIKKDGSVNCLTTDHKPEDPEETIRIRAAKGTVSANRVDGQLAMSRAIGDWTYKSNPALKPEEQKVIAVPDIFKAEAEAGDIVLVICDGIVEQMSNEQVGEFVHKAVQESAADPADIVAKLLEESIRVGSKDNHSGILVMLTDGSEYTASLPATQYMPGPYKRYSRCKEFRKAYLQDAKKHGVSREELMKLAEDVDANDTEQAQDAAAEDDVVMGGEGDEGEGDEDQVSIPQQMLLRMLQSGELQLVQTPQGMMRLVRTGAGGGGMGLSNDEGEGDDSSVVSVIEELLRGQDLEVEDAEEEPAPEKKKSKKKKNKKKSSAQ